jgi:hypothetical protein
MSRSERNLGAYEGRSGALYDPIAPHQRFCPEGDWKHAFILECFGFR